MWMVSVSLSMESRDFLAGGLLYRQKTKVSKCQKLLILLKVERRSDTKMFDENSSRIRAKNMMYTQQLKHLPTKSIENLIGEVEKINPKKYALIVHDKDINESGEHVEDHVHMMMSFDNARSIRSISKALKDKSQSIEMWKGKAENGYSYLIHATKDSINKYQYSPIDVKANFNYVEEIRRITEAVEKSRQMTNSTLLLDALYRGEITKAELEKMLSGSQYGRMKRQIEDVWSKQLQFRAIEWRNEMIRSGKEIEVVWISGKAGTGKTSLAKQYAEKLKRPYFITGSSKDIFQNYSGEHTMIIDEFRTDMIKYPDLLRILDPFGSQVMAPSRYHDKSLACDLIIITSPYNPVAFYRELFKTTPIHSVDSLEQLLRRITLTIEMDDLSIKAVEYDMESGVYKAVKNATKKNNYSKHFRKSEGNKKNIKVLFDTLFD